MKTGSRDIPSLDGLRAVSFGMVLVSHLNNVLQIVFPAIPLWLYHAWGFSGVGVFFVISGFLITHLLLKEFDATGKISLKRFYFRRAFRIFPPFYIYLAAAAILTAIGVFPGSQRGFVVAATYTSNYLSTGSMILEHTWSLSLEEQFYLVWPVTLLFLGRNKSTKLAVWLILLSPLSRVASYFLMPNRRVYLMGMLHSHIDTIMFGCLMALLWKSQRFQDSIRCLLKGWVAVLSGFFLIVVHPMLEARFRGSYEMVFGISLSGIAISLILLYAMQAPASRFGCFLNTPLLRHLGVISYSLYLWQQPFTRENGVRFFPWNVFAIVVTAELSYWIIERPSFRIRDRLERTLKLRRTATSEPANMSAGY